MWRDKLEQGGFRVVFEEHVLTVHSVPEHETRPRKDAYVSPLTGHVVRESRPSRHQSASDVP